MSSFTTKQAQPKSLSSFLETNNDEDDLKWGGIDPLSHQAFDTAAPTTPTRSTADAAADSNQQLHFFNNLPSSKHMFFLDKVRALEHFFQVNFETNSATTAYFAVNSTTQRLRRVVSQDREALSSSVFLAAEDTADVAEIQKWRQKLGKHLIDKHYPTTTTLVHLGKGRMCTLGELYIHPNRQDLIKEIQETVPMNALDALDQSLMLDVLSISEVVAEAEATATTTPPVVEGKDRPCSVAALVLIYDAQGCCCNRESILGGLLVPEIGALVLHQTRVSAQHLWLSPSVPLQSMHGAGKEATSSTAPDPGVGLEGPAMILTGCDLEVFDSVLVEAKGVLRKRM